MISILIQDIHEFNALSWLPHRKRYFELELCDRFGFSQWLCEVEEVSFHSKM